MSERSGDAWFWPTPSAPSVVRKESLTILVPSSQVVSGGDKFPYRGIGSSRLDCGDDVRHPSRLVLRRGETRRGEILFGTLNVCEGMDDKIADFYKLIKDRRLDILCMNETKRKDSGGAIKRGSFDTYWSSVDQSQR
ncbi:hypothetical protein EVAR_8529_1 [Eumeta japonica]|uniref:Craniofacial development protein 2 n=1 Tax=Eumeta variegata TaxID=151549 RepID=A0A4C1TXW9_EUMVA|nr:hypothetical protein EVAR_8529_1 [Eumeta japonica]